MATKSADQLLDRSAWVEAALAMLVNSSIEKVGVEPLAKKLGVTKGSFYWHFKDRAELHLAILQTWRQRATLNVIDRLEHSHLSPEERLRAMIELPNPTPKNRQAAQLELAIRGWARRDPLAAEALAEIDQQRLAYLTALFRQSGFDDRTAQARAYLLYGYQFAVSMIRPSSKRIDSATRHDAVAATILARET